LFPDIHGFPGFGREDRGIRVGCIDICVPKYYKWTQWAFIQMFNHWFNKDTQKAEPIAKLSAVIEKLDKKANVVDVIEVFMAFSKWIEYRSTIDPEVTPELVRAINKYQDLYITEQMGIK
jgi:hypothetical protein